MPKRQALLTLRAEMALGFKVALAVVGVVPAALALLFGLRSLLLTLVLSGTASGTRLDEERARRVVAEQSQVLSRVLALAQRSPLPKSEDPTCQSLAAELGALDIRFEASSDGPWVQITYGRGGLPETYAHQLVWVPEDSAMHIRAGLDRLGEHFNYIDRGWWRVCW